MTMGFGYSPRGGSGGDSRSVCFSMYGCDLAVDMKVGLISSEAIALTAGRAQVAVFAQEADIIFDLLINGSSIYSNEESKPVIRALSRYADITIPDCTVIAPWHLVEVCILQVGSTVAGKDLSVTLGGTVIKNYSPPAL